MRKKIFALLLLSVSLSFQHPANSQSIRIGLFDESAIQTFVFTTESGRYQFQSDSIHKVQLKKGNQLYISLIDSILSVRVANSGSLFVSRLFLAGEDSLASFSLRPAYPAMDMRIYKGSCLFTAGIGRIQAINEVNINDYLSSVVAAEGGTSASIEFYKAQAVLCRTYLLANFSKHSTEGFNLCDAIHCQAYHGINNENNAIRDAVDATENEVAVYKDTILINAAYHSNCGGETQNSENEWLQSLPYLKSVKDSFCLNSPNRKWELKISKTKWLAYLAYNGIAFNPKDSPLILDFAQKTRKAYYIVAGDSIAFRKIRNDWGLKSSFFSVKVDSKGTIILHGKGYGHGIGMCQTGAINMAQKGYTYRDILNFYFKDITIKRADELR